jgi:hypothetical protein
MRIIIISIICILIVPICFAQNQQQYRFFETNKNSITVITDDGEKISYPSGTRMSLIEPDKYLVYHAQKKMYVPVKIENQNKLIRENAPVNDHNKCLKYSKHDELFSQEAKEIFYEVRNRYLLENQINENEFSKRSPAFAQLLNELENKFLKLENSPELSQKLEQSLNQSLPVISPKEKNNVALMQHYTDLIQNTFDPIASHRKDQLTFSQTTLYVPLSHSWFESHPELKTWHQQNYKSIGSPFAGGSGEGIGKFDDEVDSHFALNKEMLFRLKNKILSEQFKALEQKTNSNCPQQETLNEYFMRTEESKWLMQLSEDDFRHIDRMIFIHDKSWNKDASQTWSDYIPVDQSIGCFPSNRFFSTLIHELNVNSGFSPYFTSDTHAEIPDVDQTIQQIYQNGLNNSRVMKSLTAREPSLQTFYLKLILDQIE